MKRFLAAISKRWNLLFALAGCAVMAAPPFLLTDRHASPNRDIAPPYIVKAITAENGVPCVLAVGGGQGGLAISCDWSASHAPSVAVPR
ncbi:hypothetical protein [Burkholderia glumae]|uniref:hypothetical protein n=1 Tax=Burkholderia glumae TaxID=337 RepID=UPI00214FC29F|nr:hypothetical protein [Burkholderia glumae]